jgi:hypothetical protein
MSLRFVDDILENEIYNIVIPQIFENMESEYKIIIKKYVVRLINIISACFIFHLDIKIYYRQLKQNNYQDIKWLIYHLLPFLNEKNNDKIKTFNDIYVNKYEDVDINKKEPQYLHSNIQYNRCNRGDKNKNKYTERQFNMLDIEHNFILLVVSIKIMSHKMHVNWIDILPITYIGYDRTRLYQETSRIFRDNSIVDWNPSEICDMGIDEEKACEILSEKSIGLSSNDIYNCITNDLYYSVKDVKWLLYDIPTNSKIYPIIGILNVFFNLDICLNNTLWDEIGIMEQTSFTRTWEEIIKFSKSMSDLNYTDFIITNESLKKMAQGIITQFNKENYLVEEAEEEGYITVEQSIEHYKELNKFDENKESISFLVIIESLESLKPKFVYSFFTKSLQQFKQTWYSIRLLSKDKKHFNNEFENLYINRNKVEVTYKNIYNFAKSLCHHTEIINNEKVFSEYPHQWVSLNINERNEILKRLNKGYTNSNDWFNIMRYITYLGVKHFPSDLQDVISINQALYTTIKELLPNIIFEALVTKGVLTEFIPNNEKTDLDKTSRNEIYKYQSKLLSRTQDNPYWTDSYHYLTSLPYSQMDKFYTENEEYDYFKYGSEKGKTWYTAYSYDWIAQIGFCHHFINNRVIFITGATGVGKSTEIPKIFMYYLKAIDYNPSGRVICTQPRKAPTSSNSEYVSTALGIPMYETKNSEKKESNFHYIQMKHSEDSHTNNNSQHQTLEYSTDGSFMVKVNDPLMKMKRKNGTYINKNVYDIMMIDEAHEHKINMDMLLTLLKTPVAYNNTLRLVILSATMDEDEHRYRRYYRDINDNRKFPLNMSISENKIDRINVDRRFHISPPGMGTKFIVTQTYRPNTKESDMVMEILNKSTTGDILIFQSGVASITKLVTELNDIIPSYVIALPYHSKMSKEAREFIEKIGSKLPELKLNKSDDFTNATKFSIGNNSYSRAIIIATNAAEASITISSLKFVIDTGTQKVQSYDYIKRGERLIETYISESSRIQRTGRAGRTQSGDVYYLYEKGKMEKNRISYEISTKDLSFDLFKKLQLNSGEKVFIEKEHNPYDGEHKITSEIIKKEISKDISNILLENYFPGNKFYEYIGNDESYDYKNKQDLPVYYTTGFDSKTLTDNNGRFYMIHPDELQLERNIGGEIVGLINMSSSDSTELIFDKSTKTIVSKKIDSFWDTLHNYMYVMEKENTIIKTQMGVKILELFELLQLENHGLFRALIFALSFGYEDFFQLYTIYKLTGSNLSSLCENNRIDPTLISLLRHNKSDSESILQITNELHVFLNGQNIREKINSKTYISEIQNNTDLNEKQIFSLLGPKDKYDKELKNKITDGGKKIEKDFNTQLMKIHQSKVNESYENIIKWCKPRKLNLDMIIRYIEEYARIRSDFNKILSDENVKFFTNIKKHITESGIDVYQNIIIYSLIFGFPFNVCKYIDNSKHYISLHSPYLSNTFKIPSLSPYKFIPNILTSPNLYLNYVLYIHLDIEFDTILCLHSVTPNMLFLSDVYLENINKINDDDIKKSIENNSKYSIKKYCTSQTFAHDINLVTKVILNYKSTLDNSKKDLNHTNSNGKKLINTLCNMTID